MDNFTNRMLGQYRIVDEIGRGGMAQVYRAEQPSIGREVAVKVLPTHFLQDKTFLERFIREVKVVAGLQHPHILPVYDFGEQDGIPYIVMAYLTGGTLADRIQQSGGGMALEETTRLLDQIAEALDFAHAKGIIHRDFKPSNVLLDENGNAYLADFGIAKATEATAQLTGSGIVGTPAYMAPEMSMQGGVTSLVDVYALGVTLFQMLSGRLPYQADTPMGVLMAHMSHPVPDIRSLRPDLPDAVQTVIERAMAKEPGQRFPNARELVKAFHKALSGEPVEAPDLFTTPIPRAGEKAGVSTPLPEPTDRLAPESPAAPVEAKPARQGRMWMVGAVLGLLLVACVVVAGVMAARLLKGRSSPAVSGLTETPAGDKSAAALPEGGETVATDTPLPPEEPPTEAPTDEPASGEPTTGELTVLYEDDFERTGDLPNEEDNYYLDGQYEMKRLIWGGIFDDLYWALVPGITAEAFIADLDVQLTTNAEYGAVGFVFGYQSGASAPWFVVLLSNRGELYVERTPANATSFSESVVLVDWEPYGAINKGYAPNHLKLTVDGQKVVIHANDNLLTTIDLAGYEGGQFGPASMAYFPPGTDDSQSYEVFARVDNLRVTTYAPPTGDAGGGELPGTVAGRMCYPSSGIPPMTIYAENVDTGEIFEKAHSGETQYTFEGLPPGTYYFYAYAKDAGIPGAYTPFAPCGWDQVDCPDDHSLIPVEVGPGEIVTGIDICDWYLPLDEAPPEPGS